MSNFKKFKVFSFFILLNQSITSKEFFHWTKLVFDLILLFILSKIFLETILISDFIVLIKRHSNKKNYKFHRIFNKNTIKISYSCLPNMRNIINTHNKKILEAENKTKKTCNCRNKTNCQFSG